LPWRYLRLWSRSLAIGSAIAEGKRQAGRERAAQEYRKRLKRDLTRPLIEIEAALQRLHEEGKSHGWDGDFYRPTWEKEYLDGIIAIRTHGATVTCGSYTANYAQRYFEQFRVLEEIKRQAKRNAARQATFAATKVRVRAWLAYVRACF
jgi:hypothetical protein